MSKTERRKPIDGIGSQLPAIPDYLEPFFIIIPHDLAVGASRMDGVTRFQLAAAR